MFFYMGESIPRCYWLYYSCNLLFLLWHSDVGVKSFNIRPFMYPFSGKHQSINNTSILLHFCPSNGHAHWHQVCWWIFECPIGRWHSEKLNKANTAWGICWCTLTDIIKLPTRHGTNNCICLLLRFWRCKTDSLVPEIINGMISSQVWGAKYPVMGNRQRHRNDYCDDLHVSMSS